MPQPFKPFAPARKRSSSRPLADLVVPCIGPVLAKHGFGEADILMHWPEIVGQSLADHCQPLKLQWRARGTRPEPAARIEPATLIVRVEGAFALALQHMAAVVVEKVNAHLGWRCVGKLALRQGPLTRVEPTKRDMPVPDPAVQARARGIVGEVGDEALRDALTKLGSMVLQKSARGVAKPPLREK